MDQITSIFNDIFEWAEHHAGLGGWVGAIGSIIAVLAAWFISRGEYLRTERQRAARRKEEIKRLEEITDNYEQEVILKYKIAVERDIEVPFDAEYYHKNSPEFVAMRDLENTSVTQWPSLSLYLAFRNYQQFSTHLLQTFKKMKETNHTDDFSWGAQIKHHNDQYRKLKSVFETERRLTST